MVVAVGCCSWFSSFLQREDGREGTDRSREGGKQEEELSAAVASMEVEKKTFDLKEVAQHKAQDDCWMVIHGKVKKAFQVCGSICFSSSSFLRPHGTSEPYRMIGGLLLKSFLVC